jgi:hypothetical protein
MISDKIIRKCNAVQLLAETLGVTGVISSYPKEKWNGRLNYSIAKQAATLMITDETWEILSEVGNIGFNRDSRKAADYALDLIYGWMVEDIVIAYLTSKGFTVTKTGADNERRFLKSGAIKSDLDIEVITPEGKIEHFDIYFDSNGYWFKYDKIDIRESKWNTLVKNNAYMICVSNEGVAIIGTNDNHTIAPNPLWGGKNSATVKGIKSKLKPAVNLAQSLTDHM